MESVLILSNIRRFGGAWMASTNTLDPDGMVDGRIELEASCALLSAVQEDDTRLRQERILIPESYNSSRTWAPSVVLPSRQTNVFVGRQRELRELTEWWRDKQSRAALIHGEGGIGKTTLVLEFLNRILQGRLEVEQLEWTPQLIFFYTTKRTRWTSSGLEILGGVVPDITDVLRELVFEIAPVRRRDWYSEESFSKLVSMAADVCAGIGLKREDILIVLDNTENLARSPNAEVELNEHLTLISRYIGRLIVTSRRHERIEARQISVDRLEPESAIGLVQELAVQYGAVAIQQAGSSTVRSAVERLSRKPLLLDVFVRWMGMTGAGIDESIRMILSQEQNALGDFLFSDAWTRISVPQQRVFFVLASIGDVHSDIILRWICAECGVQINDWLEAFSETRFGSVRDYGSSFDLLLDASAQQYISRRSGAQNRNEADSIARIAKSIVARYRSLLNARSARVSDRVAGAFRSTAARAAYLAAKRGDMEEAILWYDEAITLEPDNAALHDRFAWYLMSNRQYERALVLAQRACQLDPADADAQFTAGMISARLGHVEKANVFFDRALGLGKASHLVALQRSRVYVSQLRGQQMSASRRREVIRIIERLFVEATLSSEESEFDRRHAHELERVRQSFRAVR